MSSNTATTPPNVPQVQSDNIPDALKVPGTMTAPLVIDPLAAQSRRRSSPQLIAFLAMMLPDEPLADVNGSIRWQMTTKEHARWWKIASARRAKYPGYQACPRKREEMKYGNMPADDAPLGDFLRARISHAKALWSRDVEANWTQLRFSDWLRLHVDGKTWIPPLWPNDPAWSEALKLMRIMCGLPPFAPTETWVLRPPPRVSSRRATR